MREMKVGQMKPRAAADWFSDKHLKQWSRSHFSEVSKFDILLNNVCETFNKAILDARDKPIITMLEWIRQWLMERLQKNREIAEKWKKKLPPKIQDILLAHMKDLGECVPLKSTNRHFEVECGDGSYAVDLKKRTCTCRVWNLSGIPCKHAFSTIFHEGLKSEDFVDAFYSVETYRRVYAPAILPIAGSKEWAPTLFIPPMPPNFGRGVGRPKVKIRLEPDEKQGRMVDSLKRYHSKINCGKCGVEGHNTRTCQERQQEGYGVAIQDTRINKLQVIRNKTWFGSGVSNVGTTMQNDVVEVFSRGKGKTCKRKTYGDETKVAKGKAVTPKGPSIRPPLNLEDEDDDDDWKALMSQGSNPTPLGMPSIPNVVGPSPYQQLKHSTPLAPLQHVSAGPPPPFLHGNLRSHFTTQNLEEMAQKRIFVRGSKFMDLS